MTDPGGVGRLVKSLGDHWLFRAGWEGVAVAVAVAVAVVVVVVVVVVVTIASRQSKQRQKKKVTQVWWQRFAVEISES